MSKEATTIRDIAQALGCSHMTVSRALRGAPGVSKEKATKIRQLANEMGYAPNPLVSALMQTRKHKRPTSRATNLAFIHYGNTRRLAASNESSRGLLAGAEARAAALGYALEVVWGAEPGMGAARLSQSLKARGVSGVVFAPLPPGVTRVDFDWDQFSMASMGFTMREPAIHRVGTYQYHSIPIAYRELIRLGYRRIGICITSEGSRRVDWAWDASLAKLRHEADGGSVHLMPEQLRDYGKLATFLEKKRIDAVINADHPFLRSYLSELSVRVPDDLGYVSFFEADTATVCRDWRGIGAEAINLVDSQLMHNERGIPGKPKTVLIEGEWLPHRTVRRR